MAQLAQVARVARVARVAVSRRRFEVAAVFGPAWQAARADGPRAFPITLSCTALIALFALVQHTAAGWWVVEHTAGVYQALPLPLILARLPLSMFAPAPELPAWGALAQVLVVFGFSEIHLGRARTLITAVCVNGLTTLSARIMVVVGLHFAIGTPQADQYELDTGPSTVVVALSIYVALVCRAYVLLTITAAAMATEAVVLPNLAGREHLVAVGLGAIAYLIGERALPRRARRAVTRSSAPLRAPAPTFALAPAPAPAAAPALAPAPGPASTAARAPAGAPAAAPSPAPAPAAATADTPRPLAPGAVPPRPGSRP